MFIVCRFVVYARILQHCITPNNSKRISSYNCRIEQKLLVRLQANQLPVFKMDIFSPTTHTYTQTLYSLLHHVSYCFWPATWTHKNEKQAKNKIEKQESMKFYTKQERNTATLAARINCQHTYTIAEQCQTTKKTTVALDCRSLKQVPCP